MKMYLKAFLSIIKKTLKEGEKNVLGIGIIRYK